MILDTDHPIEFKKKDDIIAIKDVAITIQNKRLKIKDEIIAIKNGNLKLKMILLQSMIKCLR